MTDQLTASFQQIVDGMREPFYARVKESVIATARRFAEGPESVIGMSRRQAFMDVWSNRSRNRRIIERVFDCTDSIFTGIDEVTLDVFASKEAKFATDSFFDGFIAKNVRKLEGVLKGVAIEKINHGFQSDLTGWVWVGCEKGAQISMSFSIEYAMSPKGKWFSRFPTRFHDIVCTDGTRIKYASEAKAKSDFH